MSVMLSNVLVVDALGMAADMLWLLEMIDLWPDPFVMVDTVEKLDLAVDARVVGDMFVPSEV